MSEDLTENEAGSRDESKKARNFNSDGDLDAYVDLGARLRLNVVSNGACYAVFLDDHILLEGVLTKKIMAVLSRCYPAVAEKIERVDPKYEIHGNVLTGVRCFNPKEWDADLDAHKVWWKIHAGYGEEIDLDGKWSKFRLNGMDVLRDFKKKISYFSLPAKIQVYSDSDVSEFSIVLDEDFLIYRSNEVPKFIWNFFRNWDFLVEEDLKRAEEEEWERKQKELAQEK